MNRVETLDLLFQMLVEHFSKVVNCLYVDPCRPFIHIGVEYRLCFVLLTVAVFVGDGRGVLRRQEFLFKNLIWWRFTALG